MQTLALYAILCASLFYLGSRATITMRLWSSYPPGFARFADCPACTGFWWGVSLSLVFGDVFGAVFVRGLLGARFNPPFVEVWSVVLEAVLTGLAMIVLVPMVAGLMQHALNVVGSAVEPDVPMTVDDFDGIIAPNKLGKCERCGASSLLVEPGQPLCAKCQIIDERGKAPTS